jgi:hypothetical protein
LVNFTNEHHLVDANHLGTDSIDDNPLVHNDLIDELTTRLQVP